jgi:release factor glutamine methyltransferase
VSAPTWDALLAASGLPRLDGRALLEHASGRRREWLLAHGDEPADDAAARRFGELAARRRAGEPLAYLTGMREFLGRPFAVDASVLVPRPDTELLVAAVLDRLPPPGPRPPRVLDLGTGSGAIAVSLALARPDAAVTATDRSTAALACARANARRLGADAIAWRLGPWWDALAATDGPFEAIVANPPYLAAEDPHLADPALQREPREALAAGPSGLEALAAIAAGACARLAAGGWLLLEHGASQGAAVRALLVRGGLADVATLDDLAHLPRVTLGRRPGDAAAPAGQSHGD